MMQDGKDRNISNMYFSMCVPFMSFSSSCHLHDQNVLSMTTISRFFISYDVTCQRV